MIDRRFAVVVGVLILASVGVVVAWMLSARAPGFEPSTVQTPATHALAAGVVGPSGVLQPALAPALDNAPLQPAVVQQPAGRPRLRGIVQLPNGAPAAGTTVTLFRLTSAWPEWQRVAVETAYTGASGTFEFAAERAPDLLVRFEHPDHAEGLRELPASLPELVLRLRRGFDVEGTVTNDIGRPMAGVQVALESMATDDRTVRTAETSSNGRYRFDRVAVGTVRLVARDPIWQPAVRNNVVVGGNRTIDLGFERPALSIEGRVVAAATQELVGAASVLALPPGQFLGRNHPATAMTSVDGRFRLEGLAPGNLRLEIRHPNHGTVARTIVVGPAPTPLSIDLPARMRVRGRVRSESALPEGLVLLLRSAADELTTAVVAPGGTFEFATAVTPGSATLAAADGRCAFSAGASTLQIQVGETEADATLDLVVGPPAVVGGVVTDADQRPLAGVRIVARQIGMFAERMRQAGSALLDRDIRRFGDALTRSASGGPDLLLAVTGSDGAFAVAGLPPGAVELRFAADGYGSQKLDVEVLAAGATSGVHRVVLGRGCVVRGRVARGGVALAGAQVGVVVDGLAVSTVTDVDGRYELTDLPAGEYRVRARYATFPTVLADQPAVTTPAQPSTIDLEFPPGRVVRGVVRGGEQQPVEGALVLVRGEQGDPVVTDSAGTFSLEAPQGALELQVVFGERASRRFVPVAANADSVSIQIDAPPNCTVRGTAMGLPGRLPLAGLLMRLWRTDGDFADVETRWIELSNGQLNYPWFPAGRWTVTFATQGHVPIAREVELQAGDDYSFDELLFEPGCELAGLLLGEQDRPVNGAEVCLGSEGDLDALAAPLRSGVDGRFRILGVASAAATLVVRAPGYAVAVVPLQLPKDVLGRDPFVVRLERGAVIEVEIAAEDAEGSMVILRQGNRVVATAEVSAGGTAVFQNRGRGDYVAQRFGDDEQQAQVVVSKSGEVVRVRL